MTSNSQKFDEAKIVSDKHGIEMIRRDVPYIEIQADDLVDVAKTGAQQACTLISEPCFVEDAGLFIGALGGFPGPYSSYVFEKLGNDGILKLMNGIEDRRAEFLSAVAYCEPGSKPIVFEGRILGSLTEDLRGSRGFGFDPIFAPDGGEGRTFAEMTTEMKNVFSHRAKSIEKFVKWYVRNKETGGD